MFVSAYSSECSTIEPPPYFGRNEAELRECALAADAGYTEVTLTVDGKPVRLREVVSGLIAADLPRDNIFSVAPQRVQSVAHGWVALLHPLPPGSHTLVIHYEGTDVFGNIVDFTNTTTIIVAAP